MALEPKERCWSKAQDEEVEAQHIDHHAGAKRGETEKKHDKEGTKLEVGTG